MNILHYVADEFTEYNSSNYRCAIPAAAIQKSGLANTRIRSIAHWMSNTPEARRDCEWADIIIVQRVMVAESINMSRYWASKGKAIVVDFDDAYDLIRPDNAAYDFWGRGIVFVQDGDGGKSERKLDVHPIDQFKIGLSDIAAITTPSERLCKDWERYAPAYHIPNYLDMHRYTGLRKFDNGDDLIIGWGGSLSHLPSFDGSGVHKALIEIVQKYPFVKVLIVGDMRVYDILKIPKSNLIFSPYVRYTEWPKMVMRFDIGLAPLFDGYDCRRSWLKVFEYMALGIPFVASDGAPYQYLAKNFHNISNSFVAQGDVDLCNESNSEQWYAAISWMIDNIYLSRALSSALQSRIAGFCDIDNHVQEIVDTYQRIIDNA